jgi:hypothetical protein
MGRGDRSRRGTGTGSQCGTHHNGIYGGAIVTTHLPVQPSRDRERTVKPAVVAHGGHAHPTVPFPIDLEDGTVRNRRRGKFPDTGTSQNADGVDELVLGVFEAPNSSANQVTLLQDGVAKRSDGPLKVANGVDDGGVPDEVRHEASLWVSSCLATSTCHQGRPSSTLPAYGAKAQISG